MYIYVIDGWFDWLDGWAGWVGEMEIFPIFTSEFII